MKLFRTMLFLIAAVFCLAAPVHASALEEVRIQVLPDGYELSLNSLYAFQLRNLSPVGKARKFDIQLKTLNYSTLSQEGRDDINNGVIPAWDKSTGLPLKDLHFDGDDQENPKLMIEFTEDVQIDVRGTGDQKTLIIRVTTDQPPASVVLGGQQGVAIPLPDVKDAGAESEAPLMAQAKEALMKGEYDMAAELYLKVLLTAKGPLKQQARELLGVARERNGQLPHAAAEYQTYLREYPKGPDADRVRQRLAGVVTADMEPRTALKEPLTPAQKARAEQALWTSQIFGSMSQFYYWDSLKIKGGKFRQSVNYLSNDVDLNGRFKSKDMDVNARFTGGTLQNYREGGVDEDRISAMSVEVNMKEKGLYTRVGRQSLSTGGVLGRFDGVQVSQRIRPGIKLNGVYGFPVDTVKMPEIVAQKHFAGVSIDWGQPKAKWNFNTYAIEQWNTGLVDRQAVGGEMRYFDMQKAFFTMLDYDTYFKQINIASFNGHWSLPTKTSLTFAGDYRKTPLLTVNNSVQGTGFVEISDLTDRFTRKELRQLALDRTTNSKSLSAGISQDLRANLQWTADVSVSAIEGTMSTPAITLVEGSDAVAPDYTYSTELIASNVFKEEDSIIFGLGYTDSAASNDNSMNINWRYPLTSRIRFNQKLHIAFRTAKESTDRRLTTRPTAHLDIRLTKSANLELEAGTEWVTEISAGQRTKSLEEFATIGYRLSF
ncbi:MAG: tetratricopeptide repeat protein [Candidatus Omnitrophota bacterium]